MKFCLSWLNELVEHEFDPDSLCESLTMAGLEVDGTEAVANQFDNVVVGRVDKVEQHPDADRLRVCEVNDGADTFQVVCGAPNVTTGMLVPFARVGAKIFLSGNSKPLEIKKAKLRGVESNGMLCSAEELGLEESSDGILPLAEDAKPGDDVRKLLQLDDLTIELDLTPNRGDCLGLRGIGREVGVLARKPVNFPQVNEVAPASDERFPVRISAKDECPRYLGRVIKGINPGGSSPLWLQEKLRRCGLRSIDAVVDVTNYVLLEMGQPMHAFDLGKLEGAIDVRLAQQGEAITLLDGSRVEMEADTLVIADDVSAVAMAGIMGGERTAVTDSTCDVFLECAFFSPLAIAGRARRHGMHTDASHRYERGVDPDLPFKAMERATALLLEAVGGEAGPVTETTGNLPGGCEVVLRLAQVQKILGIDMEPAEIRDIFERLGFSLASETAEQMAFRVPSFRFDIAIEADLLEELARIHGYNRLPLTRTGAPSELGRVPEKSLALDALRQQLVALGYQEIISYSFVDPEVAKLVTPQSQSLIQLQNPISSDMSVMRANMAPGLLSALLHNLARQAGRLQIFETGLVFTESATGELNQEPMLGGLIYGESSPQNCFNNNRIFDFYDVKGHIEALFAMGHRGGNLRFERSELTMLHPGQSADITLAKTHSGWVGALHPQVQRELGIQHPVYLFQLSLQSLTEVSIPVGQLPSRFPAVHRDLAIVVDESLQASRLLDEIRQNAGENLVDLRIFDVYQGDAITKGQKSVALGLTWQHPSRNLTDEEINTIISKCVNALQDKFNANLRN